MGPALPRQVGPFYGTFVPAFGQGVFPKPARGKFTGSSRLPTTGSSRLPTMGSSRLPTMGSSRLPTMGSSRLPTTGSSRLPTTESSGAPTTGSSRPPSYGIYARRGQADLRWATGSCRADFQRRNRLGPVPAPLVWWRVRSHASFNCFPSAPEGARRLGE
jgi:hypothetical protein